MLECVEAAHSWNIHRVQPLNPVSSLPANRIHTVFHSRNLVVVVLQANINSRRKSKMFFGTTCSHLDDTLVCSVSRVYGLGSMV